MSVIRPFLNSDLFVNAMRFFESKDIFNLAMTCNQNNESSKTAFIWQKISEQEGVPQVANFDRTPRTNPKEDFRVLYPITLSGKKIGQFFGKVLGKVPPISQYWFDKLSEQDPYEKLKLFGDNFRFIVQPSFIERTVAKDTPLDTDENGNLIEVDPNQVVERTLTIPFSLRNHSLLCQYPLQGRDHGPVFDMTFWKDNFEQNVSFSERVRVDVMRLNALEGRKGCQFDHQELFLEEKAPKEGFKATSILARALWDTYSILKFGTCPEASPGAYSDVHCSNTVTDDDGNEFRLTIGGFIPDIGLSVACTLLDEVDMAIVPGGSAEVPESLTLEHLAIDN